MKSNGHMFQIDLNLVLTPCTSVIDDCLICVRLKVNFKYTWSGQ